MPVQAQQHVQPLAGQVPDPERDLPQRRAGPGAARLRQEDIPTPTFMPDQLADHGLVLVRHQQIARARVG
jgi:hypothetical protein